MVGHFYLNEAVLKEKAHSTFYVIGNAFSTLYKLYCFVFLKPCEVSTIVLCRRLGSR